MFKFKKSMAGVIKQENFECECCGSMDDQASTESSGCASGCGSANNSCCGPVGNGNSINGPQMPGCVPCSTPPDNSCCGDSPEKPKTSTESSGCASGCGSSNNSCCG